MDELRNEAEALGIEVDGRWSEETLMQKIIEAQEAQPKEQAVRVPRFQDVPLHILNQEAVRREKNRHLQDSQTANRARDAVLDALAKRRATGKPFRKPLRAPVA